MIFESKYPDIKIPQVGIYQYVTSNPNKISDDKVIYVDGITERSYTFGEFKHESKRFAAGLQDKLGFKRGDTLAIFSPDQVDYPIVLLGTIAAGGKVALATPKSDVTGLSYRLTESGASVLIVHPEIFEVAIEASISAKIPTSRVLLFGDKEIKGYKPYCSILINDREIEPIYYTPEEAKSTTAYLLYSSGTTGAVKGIELTHTNVTANLAQQICTDCKIGSHSIIMGVTPFSHSYALIDVLHATLIHGATTIIHSNFILKPFCESIQKYKINRIYAVPQIILELINDPLTQQFDLSSVDMIISTSAPLGDKLERKFYEMFKIPNLQTYGLAETSLALQHLDTTKNAVPGAVSLNGALTVNKEHISRFTKATILIGSSGVLLPNMKAKILSSDGYELGYNELGELWVHGPNIFKDYLNNKEATDAVIDKDGFFNTEDIASDLYVVPSELESILLIHDAVSDAAVIGYYSKEEATEILMAYITIKNGYEQSQALAEEIQSFVDEKVAPHKKLRGGILFIDRIPRNGGKILRRLLKEKLKNDIKD
ncbi:17336_t:CDS:2 [Dentiscutata erythropus]|uniref:17336_t:CDS:1 n=1 Tax=Dentiscutata erythropus TaxID=1348616 RepID=A0A9N9ED29_9GLOM|nr:17336_t:CDS:2 [Dentiscutata erythropus]